MLDLEQHLLRQMAFSRATFGPGARTAGVVDHIRKELEEVLRTRIPDLRDDRPAQWAAAREWVDVVILALDGLTRQLREILGENAAEEVAKAAARMIAQKQGMNEIRHWPDWRSAPMDKAIEHDRTVDAPIDAPMTGLP